MRTNYLLLIMTSLRIINHQPKPKSYEKVYETHTIVADNAMRYGLFFAL